MFYPNFNFSEISKNSVEGLNIYHNLLDQLLQKSDVYKHHYALLDPSKIIHTFTKVFANLYQQPDSLIELQKQYVEKSLELINYSLERAQGGSPTPLYKQQHKDKRFSDKSWSNNAYFDFIKQFYLMHRELVERVINLDKTVDIKTRKQALFFINQFLDAISPSNFIYTNPVVLYETMSTNGENIVQGLSNLSKDVEHSKNLFDISRNSRYTFKIGKNIASTPGEVVYKNDLMELICYTPTQKSNHEIPLLIVPPWINKYYILDLSPKNSLIKYLVDKGITVFILSWVNPTAKHHDTLFEDYLSKGALAAIDVIQNQFKINKLNILGYCIGGALVSILLSYLARHKKEAVINTATMLATLLDYREGGDLSLFIDEEQLEHFKENVLPQGYYDSTVMSMAFSLLRANDMIWSFAVNNYLLGKKPLPFDILYWNADSTRLPSKMHNYYLENMYLKNNLIKADKLTICGTPIDLGAIKTPCYFISTCEDHIVPWKGTYNALQYFKCPVEFILAGSGHVAGIINPPKKHKYGYWKNKDVSTNANTWFKNAKEHDGSWWEEWLVYLQKNSGKQIQVTHIKNISKKLSLEKAPGTYIHRH